MFVDNLGADCAAVGADADAVETRMLRTLPVLLMACETWVY